MLFCYCYFVINSPPLAICTDHSQRLRRSMFFNRKLGFVNVFLPTLNPSFLVVGELCCIFAVYKGIHCKVKKRQVVRRLEGPGTWRIGDRHKD